MNMFRKNEYISCGSHLFDLIKSYSIKHKTASWDTLIMQYIDVIME